MASVSSRSAMARRSVCFRGTAFPRRCRRLPVRLPACLCATSSSTVKSPGAAGRSRITSSISCGSMAATSCQLPLEDRRGLLADLPLLAPLQRVESLEDSKPWDRACAEGWEGVIAKRRGSVYEHRRSPHWLKMKCELAQELVVGGFTDPQGGRVGLGALLVGYFEDHEFVFAGKVGTGFDTKLLLDLRARLDAPRDRRKRHSRRPSAFHACAPTGCGPRSSSRLPSSSGRCTASCVTRVCSAFVRTRTLATW